MTTLHHGDCLEVLRGMPDNSVDSIVTDPPYGLSFMGKRWDYDVPAVEIWAECLRVLKPGGHLLAFAGTRTQHRMAVRIEDAGFEIRDMIAWVYGSGMPKHRSLLKPALEPITMARKPLAGTVAENVLAHGTGAINVDACRIMQEGQERDADAYRRLSSLGSASYIRGLSLSQIRGSLLHIASVLHSYSTGDTGRLRSADDLDGTLLDLALCERLVARLFPNGAWCGGSSWSVPDSLCGCQSCRHSCDEHTRLLREVAQGGAPSLADALERICSSRFGLGHNRECRCNGRPSSSDDSQLAWSFSFLVGEYCTLYSATPQSARWPANLIHDGSDEVLAGFPVTESGGSLHQRSLGRGACFGAFTPGRNVARAADTGSAARFFYAAKASKKDRGEGNIHPTVKPTDLMAYLCRLVTSPGGVVLDPFMGSGSTGKAAVLEGFRFIGIEREAEYLAIAQARIKHASQDGRLL